VADQTTNETFSKAAHEQDAGHSGNREHFAAQPWYGIDPRLTQLLTRLFRSGIDATIELTVVVDGTVISGSVVSPQPWAQRQNDQIRIGSPAIAEALDSELSKVAAEEEPGASPLPAKQDQYLHFLAPVLLSGGLQVHLQATRVDLRKVSAWSIGRIPGD
jgi:hypothetical protein